MNLGYGWLDRIKVNTSLDKKHPESNTYLEVVSGVPTLTRSAKNENVVTVSIKPESAKYDSWKGFYYDNGDSSIIKILEYAAENGENVIGRFERKRTQDNYDEDIEAILEKGMSYARDNIVRTFVGLYNQANDSWILTSEALSSPEEDPSEVLDFVKRMKSYSNSTDATMSDEDVENMFNVKQTNEVSSTKFFNKPNKDFYDKQNLLIMYFFVAGENKKYSLELPENFMQTLATVLHQMSNKLSLTLSGQSELDPDSYYHNRARYIIFSIVENFEPVKPFHEMDKEDIIRWKNNIEEKIKEVLKFANKE